MSFEQKINYQLNKIPGVKRVIKRVYQRTMYAFSPKIKSEGNIIRISPDDPNHEYFFGYYDKSPWDISDRFILCMRANNTWSDVSPKEKADILLIDTKLSDTDVNRVTKIAETNSWNVQQSCMLQWLGPDYSSRILFNDYRDGRYVSVILDLKSGLERIIDAPVYTVSADGKTALTLDFSRLYNLRPGYGYYNVPEKTKGIALPDSTAVWKIDLETGKISDLLTYKEFASFQPRSEMQADGTVHKVNHLMISPNGKRCMVLYRWFVGQRKYTRLVTFDVDTGKDMYVLSDDDMVSHCFWKNDEYILAFENKKEGGPGYYLMKDKTQEFNHCWPQLSNDGHPSYSPDGKLIVTDTYPDRARVASIKLMDGTDENKNDVEIIARVFAPFKYDNDTRCDLHPRWNHKGNKICFDSVYEGYRGLYFIETNNSNQVVSQMINSDTSNEPRFSIITPVYNSYKYMSRFFDSMEHQTYKNFEIILIDDSSFDDSYALLEQYIKSSDLNIRLIRNHQNQGPGFSRNVGIKYAIGDYLIFVDSDDYVANNLLLEINNIITNNNPDVCFFDYYRGKKSSFEKCRTLRGNINNINKTVALLNSTTSVWGKAFRKEIVKSIEFPSLMRFEDWVFMVKTIIKASSFVCIDLPLYYYVDNCDSIVHDKRNDAFIYSLKAFELIKDIVVEYSSDICEALFAREVLYVYARENAAHVSVQEMNSVIQELSKAFPDWYHNRYISSFSRKQKLVLFALRYKLYYGLKIMAKVFA